MTSANAPLAIFAHPGHELRLLHCLSELNANCLYLTDASASTGKARLHLTDKTLRQAGIPPRLEYLTQPDGEFYTALKNSNESLIRENTQHISVILARLNPSFVITDSAEGYNPVHDICHFISLVACKQAGIDVFDVALDGDPVDLDGNEEADCHIFKLGSRSLDAKLTFIRDYADNAGPQLAGEALGLLEKFGDHGQAMEILRPAKTWVSFKTACQAETPFFEAHGRRRVEEGKYKSALTFCDHLEPMIERLWSPT